MQSRLIVKNFGPIEFVDLDLRNVNVFIGPQASGKSALAKLYTIFKAPRKFLNDSNSIVEMTLGKDENNLASFKNVLIEYNILSFLKHETEIEFDSDLHSLSYKNGIIKYQSKLLNKINNLDRLKENLEVNRQEIKNEIGLLFNDFMLFRYNVNLILKHDNEERKKLDDTEHYDAFITLNEDTLNEIIAIIKDIELHLSTHVALYIPSERNFINIIKNASLNLIHNNVPIPRHILSFGAEMEKATIKEIDLSFLHENLIYKNINGEDRIYTDGNNSIKLLEAASGIQSVLPILIPILSHTILSYQRSFVIEEPELNLFPLAQYDLMKLIESKRNEVFWEDYGAIHTYTTHSPYILSALNNLLYAYEVKVKKGNEIDEQVDNIVPASINRDYFTAYQIKDGKAENIFNREAGLIEDNYIDEASDKMADDFDALMELMK